MSSLPIPANVVDSRCPGSDARADGTDGFDGKDVDSYMVLRSREITELEKLRVVVPLRNSRELFGTDDLGAPPPVEELQEAANGFIR